MAYYLVRAKPNRESLDALRKKLESGEVQKMRPFGTALDYSLRQARIAAEDVAVWEEEDYCHPPLAQERAAVLDEHFTDLSVEPVERSKGWERINHLPTLWDEPLP